MEEKQRLDRSRQAVVVVSHATRWAQNILVEVLANHGEFIDKDSRLKLCHAIDSLTNISLHKPRTEDE